MLRILLWAFVLPFPMFLTAVERTEQAAWMELVEAFNRRGSSQT